MYFGGGWVSMCIYIYIKKKKNTTTMVYIISIKEIIKP